MFLKPDYDLKSIYDIDLDELEKSGIKAMLFDLDSTLMASKTGCYSQKTLDWLEKVQSKFFTAVISNNHNKEYIEKVSAITPFPVLFEAKKPQTKPAKEFLQKYNINAKDAVFVGDRPLTDILCGKLLGCKTILVDSISADKEAKIVRFVRQLERCSIRK
ncbi:MAG: YqeG family HAD IIIA-type phosphatase [Brachyspira sp.]|jgi:HAD phosphatase, family IIIA|nr:YqeG family HAD IIIA-type phosphatase [Brachyspira sp.]CCY24732.1 hAD superfamily (Subfamily IIIA) phosphatase TIGR01668 [Brachyspira sp. CAG:484]